jgi:trigger factor
MLQDKKFVEQTYVQLQTSKLFTLLEGQVSTTEESISADEFAKKQHHHHH